MRMALIGMSGAGKSFWSQILSRHGFKAFGCDDHIGRRLAAAEEIDAPSLDHLGRWMGFPFEPGFARREGRYLSFERAVMNDLLTGLESVPADQTTPDLVIDTTGSVVYTGEAVMQRLRRQAVVIYLALPLAHRDALRRAYERHPRPVVWNGHFRKHDGETDREALRRCYDNLLEERDGLYRRYAHLEIPWSPHAGQTASVDTLLAPAAAFLNQQGTSDDG